MKKLFVAVLAIAGLVACNNEETVSVQGPAPIAFDGSFVETRATDAHDPSTTTATIEKFSVWGFMDQVAGKVFVKEEVTKNGGKWGYANTQYWVPGHNYYFAALSNYKGVTNVDTMTESANEFGLGTINYTLGNGDEDLLYSAVGPIAAPEAGATEVDPVKFSFNHMLSKVKFTFKNGFANDLATIDVTNVRMVVPSEGSINVAQQDWWSTNQWELGTATKQIAFGDACKGLKIGKSEEAANERIIFPADATQTYAIAFDVAYYQGTVLAYSGTKTVEVKDVALEIGKAYNFTATLCADNITADGNELLPIVFDVEEVKTWVEAGDVDTIGTISGEVEDITLFSDTVASATVAVKGTFDGGLNTLLVEEGAEAFYANSMLTFVNLKNDNSTIKNVTLDGNHAEWYNPANGKTYGIRNINITAAGTYNIEGVESINATYPLHVSTTAEVTLNVTNSTLQGWTSYNSGTTANFTNVKFIAGDYNRLRPYGTTVCDGCEFTNVVIDLAFLADGETITFKDCTVNDVALTAADLEGAVAGKYTIE